MQKQSIIRPNHSLAQSNMSYSLKYNNYLTCQQNFPLQLKGNMKRHSQPISNQNMSSILNYQAKNNQNKKQQKTNENCRNGQSCHQRQKRQKTQQNSAINHSRVQNNSRRTNNSKQIKSQFNGLAQKILSNNKILKASYEKSVVPGEDQRSNKHRPQSVKTYKQERQGTGINYIMESNQSNLYKIPERRHVGQFHAPSRQKFGKRCNISAKQFQSSQFGQSLNQSVRIKTSQNEENFQSRSKNLLNKMTANFAVVHAQTTKKRISQDIHSCFTKKDTQQFQKKPNYENRNQFKRSIQLGYQYKKPKQLNCQKMAQIMGSEFHGNKEGSFLRQKRDDWRRSTIIIE